MFASAAALTSSSSPASAPEPQSAGSPADAATPLLHIATLPLHNATLCYTPATPAPDLQPLLNPDQLSTSLAPANAACYTPPITSPLPATVPAIAPDPTATCDNPPSSATPATCSPDHPLLHLTPIQRQALDYLQAGHSVAATARALGIHRVTVQRWKTQHPRFIAELAHRAGLSQVEVSLKAQRAIDLAMDTLLKKLVSSPRDAQQIALRLISSPRLTRLAAASHTTSLRQALAQLQETRALETPANTPADPSTLNDLLAELDAPIPANPPKPAKPRPDAPKKLPWAPPSKPPLREVLADHPIRPELLAALQRYGCTPEQADTTARRPDITPFDIHYLALSMELAPGRQSPYTAAALVREDNLTGIGVDTPLLPSVLTSILARGLLKRIAGHDLAGYTATADREAQALILAHPSKPTITIPRNRLWRDAVFPAQECPHA